MIREIHDYYKDAQHRFDKPMPLVGIYIAVASLVCTLAMAADTLQGLLRRRLWFPCRFFTLNAATLTVIAVALKLPVDLNNQMSGILDQLTKLSSLTFLCTMMSNFMPSLGTMHDKELVLNITALAILVITIAVNICIQLSTRLILNPLFFVLVICVLVMLIIMGCSALSISTSKRVLELKYREMHINITISNKDPNKYMGKSNFEKLKDDVNKYWLMAVTSNPQFLIACSEAYPVCGAISVITAVVLVIILVIEVTGFINLKKYGSVYKHSILPILIIQLIGVVVGTIAPTFRLFSALTFKLSMNWSKNYIKVYKVESYWTQRLVEWKEISPLDIPIGGRKFRKFIHNVKNLILNFCIKFVIVVMVFSKVVRLLAIFLVIVLFYSGYCWKYIKREFTNEPSASSTHPNVEAMPSQSEFDGQYVLQLQDGVELSKRTLKNITDAINRVVQAAKERQPKELLEFLGKSKGFNGVAEFDSNELTHLHSEEPPNCWSLPVITLTSIAIALPGIKNDDINRLLDRVKEGLSYVRHIEKSLGSKGDLVKVRKASEIVWPGVELRHKWLNNNLIKQGEKKSEETLQRLGGQAEIIVKKERTVNGDMEKNAANWSVKAIAANSMYRICQTILLNYNGSECQTVFDQLSIMIADILCACLTNLPCVISMKCYCSAIEKREESVRIAACLLGETEEILKILQQRQVPSLDPEQMAYIDQWRASLKRRQIKSLRFCSTF